MRQLLLRLVSPLTEEMGCVTCPMAPPSPPLLPPPGPHLCPCPLWVLLQRWGVPRLQSPSIPRPPTLLFCAVRTGVHFSPCCCRATGRCSVWGCAIPRRQPGGVTSPPGAFKHSQVPRASCLSPAATKTGKKKRGILQFSERLRGEGEVEVQAGASGSHSPAGGDTDPSCLPLPPTAPPEPSLCHLPFGGTPRQDMVPCTMEEAKFSPPRVALSRSMGAGWEPRPLCHSWGVWEPTSPITPAPAVMALHTTPLPPAPVPTP